MLQVDVVVIGAGLSGLVCANKLKDEGLNVLVIEKGRGSGGRLSSKRLEYKSQTFSFDIGCSLMEASTPVFQKALRRWCDQGTALELGGGVIGKTRNSAITRSLCSSLDVRFSSRVDRIEQQDGGRWGVFLDDNCEPFACAPIVVISAPPQQAHDLLPEHHRFRDTLSLYHMAPQWSLSLVLKSKTAPVFDPSSSDMIKLVSNEASKRSLSASRELHPFQVQLSEFWSKQQVDLDKEAVLEHVLKELEGLSDEPFEMCAAHVHRWLYAVPEFGNPSNEVPFLLANDGVGVCGDYLGMALSKCGAEAAFLSGEHLADEIKQIS